LRETGVSAAIGNVLNPRVLTVGSIANNTGFRVCAGLDPIAAPIVHELEKVLPNLRQELIVDSAGHWVQQKRPDEVDAALVAFPRS
jgi:hypothetical protein